MRSLFRKSWPESLVGYITAACWFWFALGEAGLVARVTEAPPLASSFQSIGVSFCATMFLVSTWLIADGGRWISLVPEGLILSRPLRKSLHLSWKDLGEVYAEAGICAVRITIILRSGSKKVFVVASMRPRELKQQFLNTLNILRSVY